MATATKASFAAALKEMLEEKPVNKITVKDCVEICNVNRQTFYYHFDDVHDLLKWVFQSDMNKALLSTVEPDRLREQVLDFITFLSDNRSFILNINNSEGILHMLVAIKFGIDVYIRAFVEHTVADINIERNDFEFIVEFCTTCVIGIISRWLDEGMSFPPFFTTDRLMQAMKSSVESIAAGFKI